MKTKFLLLALLGLFFGTKMQAQTNPCAPYAALTFPPGLHVGDVVTVWNCNGSYCQYNIPTDGTVLCLTGSASPYCTGQGGAATTIEEAEGTCNGHGAIQITIDTYNDIEDNYYASWNPTTSIWDVTWPGIVAFPYDHSYTVAGHFIYPDLLWGTNSDGSLHFYLGYPGWPDDEGTMMVM